MSQANSGFLAVFAAMAAVALISNTLTVALVLRSRIIRSAEYLFNVNLALSDLIFAGAVLVTAIGSLATGRSVVADWAACQCIGYILQATGSSSVLTIGFITYNHYSVIIRERASISYASVALSLSIIWALSLTTSSVLLAAHSAFVERPAHIHCHFDYTSTEPLMRTVTMYLSVLMTGLPIVVGLVYSRVFAKVRAVEAIVNAAVGDTMSAHTTVDHFELSPSRSKQSLPPPTQSQIGPES
nr:hypothetical protein HK105_005474 [Polyrhizophydium stewartii]